MSLKRVIREPEALRLTFIAEFKAPAARVWRVWSEPKLLAAWWGTPEWPATFVQHEFQVGGRARYYLQGPEGEQHHCAWEFQAIESPRSLAIEEQVTDGDGLVQEGMPSTAMSVTLEESDGVTTMRLVTQFKSLEDLQMMVEMGMVEGMELSMAQIPALL